MICALFAAILAVACGTAGKQVLTDSVVKNGDWVLNLGAQSVMTLDELKTFEDTKAQYISPVAIIAEKGDEKLYLCYQNREDKNAKWAFVRTEGNKIADTKTFSLDNTSDFLTVDPDALTISEGWTYYEPSQLPELKNLDAEATLELLSASDTQKYLPVALLGSTESGEKNLIIARRTDGSKTQSFRMIETKGIGEKIPADSASSDGETIYEKDYIVKDDIILFSDIAK